MLRQKDRYHFISIREAFLPILVIEISLNVLLLASLVLLDDELFEGVLEYTTEDPFLKNLKVGQRRLLQKECKKSHE